MARKKASYDKELGALAGVTGASEDERIILRKAMASKHNVVCARAAAIAAEYDVGAVVPGLVDAFERFVEAPKTDAGCIAKEAIADALNALEHFDAAPFLLGVRHIQREPVWGGSVDTAASLRAQCAAGLARLDHPGIYFILVDLLMDPEIEARRGAVRALGYLAQEESELLLRMHVQNGLDAPAVFAECFSVLARINPGRSIEFLTRFIDSEIEETAAGALLALGETRTDEAATILMERWERTVLAAEKKTLLLPLALTRHERAMALLLSAVREESPSVAKEAIAVLAQFASNESVREKVAAIVDERAENALRAAFDAGF